MKITNVSLQARNKNRVNISVDGKYRFSLDVAQVGELGIKLGREYSEEELIALEMESQFGKLYGRALEYCLKRPHSAKEVRDYLYQKTRDTRTKTGAVKKGVPPELTTRVFARLVERGYIDDEKFAQFWVENRHTRKGASRRKLEIELHSKGIEPAIIEVALAQSPRDDLEELKKVITKKHSRYDDEQKFIQYLMRQGFAYDLIKQALAPDAD